MIERAVEAERKSQHMSRVFTERIEEMVQARSEEQSAEAAEAAEAEAATAAVEVVDEPPVEESHAEELPVEESEVEDASAAEEAPPADWGDASDPWASE
jgi:hypothetical protein